MVGRAKKSHGGLARPTALWIRSTRVFSVVDTCADSDLQVAGDPCLTLCYETWTLNTDLKRRIDVFGTRCVRRIMEYRWYNFVSNQRLFRETDSRPINSIVRQRHLRLYGHVARHLEADPAYQVVSVRDKLTSRRPRGCPQNSWLQQVDASCWESPSMGREPAWRHEWGRRGNPPPGVCPP